MKIGIIGLGMVGGSLGLDLRRLGHQVLGVSRREETCQVAVTRGVVDCAHTNLALLAAADAIFICTPLDAILLTVEQLIPHLSPSTILTDVSPVKTSISKAITSLWPNFIGGHPFITTDVAKRGIVAAQPHLFTKITYVLTPLESTPIKAVNTVEKIVQSLESQVYFCDPEAHDRAVALFFHLPLLVGYSLITAYLSEPNQTILQLSQKLISSNFHDLLEKQNYYLEELKHSQLNQTELLRVLQYHLSSLDRIIEQIDQEDWGELEQQLILTQQAHSKFFNRLDS
ncbi:prephenate dehydrogenase/arogenate dehydrogenase family protein [Nostoc commune]|uniref:prephenate dehydrogenase/arogenate dehydrogenase family protein n=1 Tax=Nostoc commune TaxID=1178 RepID=UPI0018C7BA88|nr:prephenate dehydrogenase/arogenate dehydrogenase family protein [Nostoc commune]MBG1264584.1 prephenate dehydrogenase/arogenate dehydrogenase family protein [Nostoc commune BAE]